MVKWIFVFVLPALLFFPLHARADSYYSNGRVHNTCGTRSNILFYKHFNITRNGYITGYIVNESDRPISNLLLDMYTMDVDEIRVFWSKTIDIGYIAPKGRYHVREPYSPVPGDPNRIVFRFKIHGSDEYHIPEK